MPGVADALAAGGLSLLFAFAMTWAGACAGMVLRSPEQAVADWNPMSAIASACRVLFGGPNPAATIHAWPVQHPELAVIIWSAALVGVFAPTAVALYRRKVLR
jgi:hypothetical protein